MNLWIYDTEVFAYDWLFVAKQPGEKERIIIHNDNEAVKRFIGTYPCLVGFNNKRYDQFIVRAILSGATPEDLKKLNDDIILYEQNAWHNPFVGASGNVSLRHIDLMDDCMQGLSLKAIEAHLGMNIEESKVDFNLDRPLTSEELDEVTRYCCYDVDATEKLYFLRKNYLASKAKLARAGNLDVYDSLSRTNAQLTARYLGASKQDRYDERNYKYPDNLLKEYIPDEVFRFFDELHDPLIPDAEVFTHKLNISAGDCEVTLGYGGIHGAIPRYHESVTPNRVIRNQDVGSYYPHLMTIEGYCSRNIYNPDTFKQVIQERMDAKRRGDKETANTLKLVVNATFGAMLNKYNDLYDPLMARSVCITGQLRLLELAEHLIADCPTLKLIQINTDGLMVSLDTKDLKKYNQICAEWQKRTGYELEEDRIAEIFQKDVNNYIEIAPDGSYKIKGAYLTRGVAPVGVFNINNNAPVVANAIIAYFVNGELPEKTIYESDNPLDFQLIAKASGKYKAVYQVQNGTLTKLQKCNRVYASKNEALGTLTKEHAGTGRQSLIPGLPPHCLVDNKNEAHIEDIDRDWYVRDAWKKIHDFLPEDKETTVQETLWDEIFKELDI